MQSLVTAVLILIFVNSRVQGNDLHLSDVSLTSDRWGDHRASGGHGVEYFRVSPNDKASFSAILTVNGRILDLWWSLRWKCGCESATRSHMCPCDCDCGSSLHIPGQCCHSDIAPGRYTWEPYRFTVPDLECGTCTYLDIIYYADWCTDECGEFCKTYDVLLHRLNVEVVCPDHDSCQDCCQDSYYDSYYDNCEDSCYDSCEDSSYDSCQDSYCDSCHDDCEDSCQDSCYDSCQDSCEDDCYDNCQDSYQDNCQDRYESPYQNNRRGSTRNHNTESLTETCRDRWLESSSWA